LLDGLNAEYYSRKGKEAVLHVREWSMDAIILCDVFKLEWVLDPRNTRFILTFDTLKSGVRVREKTWRNYVRKIYRSKNIPVRLVSK